MRTGSLWIWRVVLGCLLSTAAGRAATIVFVTAPGANILGNPINDRITFITGLNQLEIQIQNLQLNINFETQAIVAADWLLHNLNNSSISQPASGRGSVALTTSGTNLGTVINITNPPSVTTLVAGGLAGLTNRWSLFTSATQIPGGTQLTTLSGGQPNQLIIGPSPYPNPNNAVTGHNPFLETPAGTHISYVITYGANSGVTAATVVTRTRLSFGTAFATAQELDLIEETPEPGTAALSLAGFVLLSLGHLRRGRVIQAVRDRPAQS
jgi:hypothetical protein